MPSFGTAGSVLSVASGVKSLFGGSKTSSQASGANDAAVIAAQAQAEVMAKQEARNDEMWERFKEKYYPLEDELLDPANRNVEDRSEERAAEAGDAVGTSFDAQRGQTMRAMERAGVNPNDGRFRGITRSMDIAEAATRADSMNDARAMERQRVEDTNFNRALQVMSLGKGMPAQVSSGSANLASGYASNANIYGNLASRLAQDAGDAGYGGVQAIMRGIQGLGGNNGGWTGDPTFNFGGGAASAVMNGGLGTIPGSEQSNMLAMQQFEEGGEVKRGMMRGPSHEEGGIDIEVEGGEYVLPVEVVKDIGVHKIEEMIVKSKQRIAERQKRGHRPPQAMRRN